MSTPTRQFTDTIAALATPRGRAALAIVRLSGPEAVAAADRCLRSADLAAADSHTAHVGFFIGADGDAVDQVVATVFRAPRSATGEDVVEISCHGGEMAPQMILEHLFAAGARLAAPGEFTQRAFLNGKMDLAQAEAVADLIDASSRAAHRVSLRHLKGRYSEQLADLRAELLELCAYLELELDFSEEDVDFADKERLKGLLDRAETLLQELTRSYQTGEKLRDGVRVVIGGRPNAGKSTLLNALVGHDRAITSATPGTTRDEIEAEAEIEGVLFRFVDTAGLREAASAIEAEGVRRAEDSIAESDMLLYLYDLERGLDREEIGFLKEVAAGSAQGNGHTEDDGRAGAALERPALLVGNKVDLIEGKAPPRPEVGLPTATISAERGLTETVELEPITGYLRAAVAEGLSRAEHSPVVTSQRHRQHLHGALQAVRASQKALSAGASGDMLALDLREALHELGAITGEVTNEDVLDQIFSRFCIGK